MSFVLAIMLSGSCAVSRSRTQHSQQQTLLASTTTATTHARSLSLPEPQPQKARRRVQIGPPLYPAAVFFCSASRPLSTVPGFSVSSWAKPAARASTTAFLARTASMGVSPTRKASAPGRGPWS